VDVHFLLFDEIEQKVERAFVDGDVDAIGGGRFGVVSHLLSVVSFGEERSAIRNRLYMEAGTGRALRPDRTTKRKRLNTEVAEGPQRERKVGGNGGTRKKRKAYTEFAEKKKA
jgi:hypothetical protein